MHGRKYTARYREGKPRVSAKKNLKIAVNTLVDLIESTGKRDRADKRDRRNF